MKDRNIILLAIVAATCLSWSAFAGDARKKDTAQKQVPARIHYSSNFQGELEPCG